MKRGPFGLGKRLFWLALLMVVPMMPGCGGCSSAAPLVKPRRDVPDPPAPARAPAKSGTKTSATPIATFAVVA